MPRRRRRPGRYAPPTRRAGSLFVTSGPSRRRRRRLPVLPLLTGAVFVAAVAAGVYFVQAHRAANDRKREAAGAFAAAWARRDAAALWRLSSRATRGDQAGFRAAFEQADRAAGTVLARAGRPGPLTDGRVRLPVTLRTRDFGILSGTLVLRLRDDDGRGRVDWSPELRLPGLLGSEEVVRRSGRAPARADVLAADGSRLADDPLGAGIAGNPGDGDTPPTGLERLYDDRLAGRPASSLRFGDRVIRRVKARRGRPVHSTIQLALTRTAQAALGDQVGGVAVIRPRDGAVLALAGLAVSAPQPPGSTFKIITLAAALQHRIASPSSSYPARQYAVLSGVRLHNAGDESCGGSLAVSFARSCNSVFAPLGARLGARRLVRMSERFGFNETPRIPAAKPSTIASDLRDDLAVGAAAIGQERDLATPLQMASVGATIANHGVRVRPRIVREDEVVRRHVVRRGVAAVVRDMMIGVVSGGTGTAGAVPGVTVAGKTGTAELVPTQGGPVDPANTDAWFVAFAPASRPQVAIAVMLVGAGHGGDSAAPVARRVLQAAL